MKTVLSKKEINLVGLGTLGLALAALLWGSGLLHQLMLNLVRVLAHAFEFNLLRDLLRSLPVVHSGPSLFSLSATLNIVALGLLAAALLTLFVKDYLLADDVFQRIHLSLGCAFSFLVVLMSLLFVEMVAGVMLAGQAIKPFPKGVIGAEQYLSALTFVPWAALSSVMLFAAFELGRSLMNADISSPGGAKPYTPDNSDQAEGKQGLQRAA